MPARWGPRRAFFLTGIGGAFGLTALFIAQAWAGRRWGWDQATWNMTTGAWDGLLIFWIAALVHLQRRHRGAGDSSLVWAVIASKYLFSALR